MGSEQEIGHPHLSMPDRGIAGLVARPRVLVLAAVALCAGLGWAYFLAMSASMAPVMNLSVLGPGMGALEWLFGPPGADGRIAVHNFWGMPAYDTWGAADIGLVFLMWVMMALAMMVPTAAPMLLTYADLADTASRQGKRAVSVAILGAGYLAVWIGFAALAALAQWGLTELRLMTPMMEPVQTVFAGTSMLAAGLYQFTPSKDACLTKCQTPFPYFFANWTNRTGGVFKLGLEQGLFCLGCCWALMAVMFAVGVMNVVWISILGAVMAAEKLVPGKWLSRSIGVALLVTGALVLVFSEPGRVICGLN